MTEGRRIDLATWPRAEHFRYFCTFTRPQYATTVRMDVTRMMTLGKAKGLSPFRHTAWAIGTGLLAVPALCVRFRCDTVWQFDELILSSTVALKDGSYGYGYFPFQADRTAFDAECMRITTEVRTNTALNPDDGSMLNVAYLSCLPWLDFTSLDHAMPGPDDCIPRISWGKIVPKDGGFDMAMCLQVHHALADGLHVAQFFEATQNALNQV